jgi:hypothetical protein
MAIKHITDSGEVNVAVFDDGRVWFICALCQTSWLGTLTPSAQVDPSTRSDLATALQSHAADAAEAFDVGAAMRSLGVE